MPYIMSPRNQCQRACVGIQPSLKGGFDHLHHQLAGQTVTVAASCDATVTSGSKKTFLSRQSKKHKNITLRVKIGLPSMPGKYVPLKCPQDWEANSLITQFGFGPCPNPKQPAGGQELIQSAVLQNAAKVS